MCTPSRILSHDLQSIFTDRVEKRSLSINIDFIETKAVAEEDFSADLFA